MNRFKIIIIYTIVLVMAAASALPVQAETVELDTYLARVEKHSKDLKLAKKELDMAKVYKREALATALPKIQVTADYKRNLKDNFLFIDFPDPDNGGTSEQKFKINFKNDYGLQAVINQPVFSFKIGTALKAAKQYNKLTQFAYQGAHKIIITTAKKAFYQTVLLKKVWLVNKASQENAHDNYLQMKKQFDHGQISRFQLLQAETRWQNTIPATTQALRNYRLALNSLKILAGMQLDEDMDIEGNLEKTPPMPTEENKLENVLDRRPDFKALLWEEKLRGTGVKSEKANLLPSLDLNLIYNFSSQSDKFKFERKNESYIVNLSLSVPIFMGGYNRAQVQRARVELEKTKIKLEQEKDNISKELRDIRLRLEEAQSRTQAADKTLATAKKAFEIAEVTAANGLATQLELKDARLMYDQAILNRFAAVYDYLAAYFDWEFASGK